MRWFWAFSSYREGGRHAEAPRVDIIKAQDNYHVADFGLHVKKLHASDAPAKH